MDYRKLGRTGLEVGVIGLGAEHLEHEPREVVLSVVSEALDNGVNYIDLFMGSPGVRDNFGLALKGRRDKVIVAGHLGACYKDDQYYRTRDLDMNLAYFEDLLTRLGTDYIDVLMLHFIDEKDDYNQVFASGGPLDLALKLKQEGKVRYIGMSSHKVGVSTDAVNSGYIDVLMFPVNPAFDMLPGETELEALWKEQPYQQLKAENQRPVLARKELFHACMHQGTAIVAMKPYAAGWLFWKDNPSSISLSAVQCLHYALSQPGVQTAVPGFKTIEHVQAALAYLNASDEEKDYSHVLSQSGWDMKGICMYCNHCLPCPSGIDIAAVTQLSDGGIHGLSDDLRKHYQNMPKKASDCIACGLCMERCPFNVDVVANMNRAKHLFES